jgi:NADH-quinone oxidoreductase subunit L
MLNYINLIPLIPLVPLASFVILILFGSKMKEKAAYVSIGAAIAAFALSVPGILMTLKHQSVHLEWTWLYLGDRPIKLGFMIDSLSAMMLFVVTFIGSLIHIYSVGYMHGDKRYSRYFSYLSLFFFSMLLIVLGDNLIMVFVGWEMVGLCSYLLISFWFERMSAARAGMKAFLANRVGDVGFLLAILSFFWMFGTVNFEEMAAKIHSYQGAALVIPAVLLFCGAVGKSAQFPLHVWLPDAMEGPTPVSALIHAATMVAAGVYMVARSFFVFHGNIEAMQVVSYIGCFTSFMAATIALTQTDIKKVLAYSTLSQLGYMIMALGVGGYIAGPFHLMTHAFFKALLFLGAGSVIHGTGTQDIRQMGGLMKKMPITAWTFLAAFVAIAGIPPFAGFWSKDEILLSTFNSVVPGHMVLFAVGVFTEALTAFYMGRVFFLTFFGETRDKEIHAHESPYVMTIPLAILAVFSLFIGIPGSPLAGHWFQGWIQQSFPYMHPHEEHLNFGVMGASIVLAFSGLGLAYLMYVKESISADKIANAVKPLYTYSLNKWYWDEIYGAIIITPFLWSTKALYAFDVWIVDGIVNGVAMVARGLSFLQFIFDKYIVDGLVNLLGWITEKSSKMLRLIQTGLVQNYILLLVVGLALIVWFKILENMHSVL